MAPVVTFDLMGSCCGHTAPTEQPLGPYAVVLTTAENEVPQPLGSELASLLRGDDFHEKVRSYLEKEGCCTLGAFRCWVDDPVEWSQLLHVDVLGVAEQHIRHVVRCWERCRLTKPPLRRPRALLVPSGPEAPGHRSSRPVGGPRVSVQEDDAPFVHGDAEFWKGLMASHPLEGRESCHVLEACAEDICSLTPERLQRVFARVDQDSDTLIDKAELSEALQRLDFPDVAREIMDFLSRSEPRMIVRGKLPWRSFEQVFKWLRLAEIFVPQRGFLHWDADAVEETCALTVCDYSDDWCEVVDPLRRARGEGFFFAGRPTGPTLAPAGPNENRKSVRWVHMAATQGVDRLTLFRLAVKYNLHPAVVDDIIENRSPTKVERYGVYFIVSVEILSLAEEARHKDKEAKEPPRVLIHRSHTTMILAGPPTCDTLLTIHQERDDKSSWLQLWRQASAPTPGNEVLRLFEDLLKDLNIGRNRSKSGLVGGSGPNKDKDKEDHRPVLRVREEAADFLLNEVLQRIVLQLHPIAEAYALRLGYMHRQPPRRLTQDLLKEVAEIQMELNDFMRSTRPIKQVVKHFIDDGQISHVARMHLEDVADTIDAISADVGHLVEMAETLERAHKQYRDKQTNDTLFVVSMVTTAFMPMNMLTTWYGTNVHPIPETTMDNGYLTYFLPLMAGVVLATGIVMVLLRTHCAPLECLATCCARLCGCGRRSRPRPQAKMEQLPSSAKPTFTFNT